MDLPGLSLRRRAILHSLASLPGLGALGACSAPPAAEAGEDVIKRLGVRTFINAAGTYTTFTASLMPPQVFAAMQTASRQYAPLNELHDAVGKRIAVLTKSEAALVSAGAASALSIGTAACVAGTDRDKIQRLPDTSGMANEVIFQKSHRFGYDHAVRNCGVKIVEVETAADLEAAVNEKTAMMFFFNDKADAGQIGVEEFAALGKKHDVPTMIDAAADIPPVESLWRFTEMGYSLAAFSGGKGLRGPQSAGLLLGRKDLIEAGRMNGSPNSDTLCRSNKVNKEELVGMLVALEVFLDLDHDGAWKDWEARCETISQAVKDVPGLQTEIVVPPIANHVPHLHLRWDYAAAGIQPLEVATAMREGSPSIEVNPSTNDEELVIGVWMMEPGDDAMVAKRLREVLTATA
jgi:L-seryl-tRNA(Ser) seleniumtransferase